MWLTEKTSLLCEGKTELGRAFERETEQLFSCRCIEGSSPQNEDPETSPSKGRELQDSMSGPSALNGTPSTSTEDWDISYLRG